MLVINCDIILPDNQANPPIVYIILVEHVSTNLQSRHGRYGDATKFMLV